MRRQPAAPAGRDRGPCGRAARLPGGGGGGPLSRRDAPPTPRAAQRLALRRLRRLAAQNDARALRVFHAQCKYLLMACDPVRARELGRIAAQADTAPADAFAAYARELAAALAAAPTPGGHANALLHMFGYVSERLDVPARRDFLAAVEQYRDGTGTLDAPVRMLHAWITRYDVAYLKTQYYFEICLRRRP